MEQFINKKSWTNEEISFLKDNYSSLTYNELAVKLNRTRSAIQSKISKMGLIKSEQGKYSYNKRYFSSIDTQDKAYWLGFITADGCVSIKEDNYKRLKIVLQLKDKPHLEKFNKSIEGNLQIREKKVNFNNKIYECCEIIVNSTEMCDDLIKLGIVPNKTEILEMCKIPKELMPHYLRGFIDGDGCFYKGIRATGTERISVDIVGKSIILLQQFQSYLKEFNIKSYIYKKRETNFKLNINSKESILKLIDLIYKNNTICLDRKYIKAQEIAH